MTIRGSVRLLAHAGAALVVAATVLAGGSAWAVPDTDGDGISDLMDNCPDDANPDQSNLDADALGDVCDPDVDGDGELNINDNCPADSNASQLDTDTDGIGDPCDSDIGPDGRIRRANRALTPDDVYNTSASGQSRAAVVGNRGTATFTVQIRNDGPKSDTIRARGFGSTPRFTVVYRRGPTIVTDHVVAGTFQYADLAPGAVRNLTVRITARPGIPANATISRRVILTGLTRTSGEDAVKATVTRH